MERKGFELEINRVVKLVGFVLVGLVLAAFIASDFVADNILTLTDRIGFGEGEYDHQRKIFPKGADWGGITFGVDHKPVDDIVGGNEIEIQFNIQNDMNESVDLQVDLYNENDDHVTGWPDSAVWRELRVGRTWSESFSTDWDIGLADRSNFDGNNSAGDLAYNVTLTMQGQGVIAFYNATQSEVPAPRGCLICV